MALGICARGVPSFLMSVLFESIPHSDRQVQLSSAALSLCTCSNGYVLPEVCDSGELKKSCGFVALLLREIPEPVNTPIVHVSTFAMFQVRTVLMLSLMVCGQSSGPYAVKFVSKKQIYCSADWKIDIDHLAARRRLDAASTASTLRRS